MLAGNANRIADGEEPLKPSTPRGRDEFRQSMALARVDQYLSMATPLLWTGQADTIGVLGLAMNACHERNGYAEELDRIKELLSAAQDSGARCPRSTRRASGSRRGAPSSRSSTSRTSSR